jgi:hypothetical protein
MITARKKSSAIAITGTSCDDLVSHTDCLNRLDYQNRDNNRSIQDDLTAAKRHFVGQVQKIIDPATQRSEFDQIRSAVQH